MSYGDFDKEQTSKLLYDHDGDVEATVMELTQYQFNPLLVNIWQGQDDDDDDYNDDYSQMDISFNDSINPTVLPKYHELSDDIFITNITNKELPLEVRLRTMTVKVNGGSQNCLDTTL